MNSRYGIVALLLIVFSIMSLFRMCPAYSSEETASSTIGTASEEVSAVIREGTRLVVPEGSPLRKNLVTAEVVSRSMEHRISAPAVVEADPGKLVKVVPPVLGRIVRMNKGLGEQVKKGDPLFTLDSADMAQYFSEAVKAKSALELARRNLDRQKELNEAGISPRKEYEQAENDYRQAESEAERTRVRLEQLGVDSEKGNSRLYTYRSPLTGRIIELAGASGGFWNDMNAPIMSVADLSSVWLTASVQEQDIASISISQETKIVLNAYPGEEVGGRVKFINEVLDSDTRTVKVRIAVENESGHYRPGMFAKVTFSGLAHEAVIIPASALVQSGFNTRVFVETSPWCFEPRVVKTGSSSGNEMEVLSGLQTGERIVIKEGVLLND